MDILKATPKFLAQYLGFLMNYTISPAGTAKNIVESSDSNESSLNNEFVLYSLLSVGLAVIVVQIGNAIGMTEDSSRIIKFLGEFDQKMLPVVALISIVLLSVIVHIILRIVGLLQILLGHEKFSGSIFNTVNAALCFSAWFIPLFTTEVILLRIADYHSTDLADHPGILVAILLLPSLLFWVYMTMTFATLHKISNARAGTLFAFTIVLFSLIRDFLN